MTNRFLFLLCCLFPLLAFGQAGKLKPADRDSLEAKQEQLLALSYIMHTDSTDDHRFQACRALIKGLVEALKTPNSYNFDFSGLQGVVVKTSPDNSFRIFSWELNVTADQYRHYGAIQMNSKQLKLTPLLDRGDQYRENPENKIVGADNWLGYVVYNLVRGGTFDGKPYYFVFGYDRYGTWRRQKILDVLTFDELGKPQFGLPLFVTYNAEGLLMQDRARIILNYGAEASVALRYEEAIGTIMYENLILMPGGSGEGPIYMPDGSYHALELNDDGRWHEEEKVFTHTYEEAPRPAPKAVEKVNILGKPDGGGGEE